MPDLGPAMEKHTANLNRIRGVANYQFPHNIGLAFFPDETKIGLSKKTGRIRHLYLDSTLLATFRPNDGLFSLTIEGAKRLGVLLEPPTLRVVVRDDIEPFAKEGRNVFARHVIRADPAIRPGEEVLVTSAADAVLAVGKAVLTGREMLAFKRGVAVKTRRGVDQAEP